MSINDPNRTVHRSDSEGEPQDLTLSHVDPPTRTVPPSDLASTPCDPGSTDAPTRTINHSQPIDGHAVEDSTRVPVEAGTRSVALGGSVSIGTVVPPSEEVVERAARSTVEILAWNRPTVPGYTIESELGRGAMGVVYKARQPAVNRTVALKMILAGSHANVMTQVRFQIEAEAIAALHHPHVVHLYDFGPNNGLPYFAMEFVGGGTLAEKLRRESRFSPTFAAGMVARLADGMAAAHARGIVHRDLKPANVLLTEAGEPKIADFGLAKVGQSEMTASGAIMGTPSYMAPEQAAGKVREIGTTADVWAMGAILYALLTGRPPFRGDSDLDTIQQVLTREPDRPRALDPTIPRDLETICLKCLEKDPRKRFPTADALASDLRAFLDGEPITARPMGALEKVWRWSARHQGRVAVILAICLGTPLVPILILKSETDRKDATLARQEAALNAGRLDEARRHENARTRYASLFAEAERAAAIAHPDATTWEAVVRSLQLANEVAKTEPYAFTEWSPKASADRLQNKANAALADLRRLEVDARLRENERSKLIRLNELHSDAVFFATLATGLGLEDNLERVRQAVAEGLALFQIDIAGDGPPRVAAGFFAPDEIRTVTSRCYELLLLDAQAQTRPITGETVGALRARVREAIRRLDRADRLLPGTKIRSGLTQRAEYLAALDKKEESESIAKEAEATAPVLATDYFLIGLGHYSGEEFGKAIPDLVATLAAEPGHYGAQYLLAVCQLRQGKFQEAKIGLTRCLAQRPGFLWPRLLRASAEMDLARQGSGSYQLAREDLDAVLASLPDAAARYVALTNRGVLAISLRDWASAVTHLKDAIRQRPDALPAYINLALTYRKRAEDPRVFALALAPGGTFVYQVAYTEYRRHELDEAVSVLDEAIRRQPNVSRLYHERGRIHLLRGETTTARTDLARAMTLASTLGSISTLADDLLELGRLMYASGECSNAAQTYAAVLQLPAAYIAGEKRAMAARRLAEPLIALKKWKEAAAALDLYLELNGGSQALPEGHSRRMAAVLKLRGLIHANQNDLRAALDDYTRSLGFVRDPEVLVLRGWAYHSIGAEGLGLKDFEEVLRLQPGHSSALLGRADARVKSDQLREALADADEALRNASADLRSQARHQLLYNASRVYAQLAQREPDPAAVGRHLTRTAELLRKILSDTPRADRPKVWKDLVVADPVLSKLSQNPAMAALAAEFGVTGP